MTWLYVVSAAISVALLIYLIYALINAEDF